MQSSETSQNGVIRVRVSDLLFALQKRWMIIVALSLVGLTFGLILSAMTVVQSSYQSYNINGSFAVSSKNLNGQYVGGYNAPNVNDFHLAEDMVDAVRYVLRSERVLTDVINENELLGYTVAQIRNAITVTQYNSTQILEMRLTWRNAEEGLDVWKSVVRHASEILPQSLQLGSLEIINEPKAELIGVVGGGNNKVVLLTLLGFAAGVGFAVVELLMHPTLNNVRDVESLFNVETVGVIPHDHDYYKRKDSMMTREDVGNSLVVQNFAAAAYILRNRLGTRDGHHCFYVTSATTGEGKTTVAANLAIQLSDMEHKTLLIDFDTRNPNLGALFLSKVDYEHSLNALYRGDVQPDEAITTLSGFLDILPAVREHNAINVDNMLIELVDNLKQKYEYIIMDAPPVGIVSGTLSLNQVADSVLFVIGYDDSSLPEIQSSLEKLDKSGTRVLGCIVNNVTSGKALGMTPTADDHKKNISRKAAQKKKEEEKFGFDDVNPVGEALAVSKAGKTAKGKSGKKGRKVKRGLFGRKEKAAPSAVVAEEVTDEEKPTLAPGKKRNVYEDSIQQQEQTEQQHVLTDQETVTELVKMGLNNDWGHDAADEEPSHDADAVQENAPETAPGGEADDARQESAPGEGKRSVHTVSLKRRSVRVAAQSAQPQLIVIAETPAAEDSNARVVEQAPEEAKPEKQSAVIPEDTEAAEDAPSQEGQEHDESAESEKTEGRVLDGGRLILYTLAAIPVSILVIGVLIALAAVFAGASAAGLVYGAGAAQAVLHGYTELADRLAAGGLSLSAFALGLAMFWLVIRMLIGTIPGFIRAVIARGRKWCSKEEET